jgi:hypothetical protein
MLMVTNPSPLPERKNPANVVLFHCGGAAVFVKKKKKEKEKVYARDDAAARPRCALQPESRVSRID